MRMHGLDVIRIKKDIGEAVVFKNEGPEIHAKRRSEGDARGYNYDYWLKVASHHYSNYAEPELSEGFDTIHQMSLS